MHARIEVTEGPDAGRRFRIPNSEVRIGRGAGHQIKLEDPSWEEGYLLLQYRNSGYLVTNLMPHSIFLDKSVIRHGQQQTWYSGACLQPSKATLLHLEINDAPLTDSPRIISVTEDANETPSSFDWKLVGMTAFLAVIVLTGVAVMVPKRSPIPRIAAQVNDFCDQLEDWIHHPRAGVRVRQLSTAFREAVYEDGCRRKEAASQRYRDALSMIERIRRQEGDALPDRLNETLAQSSRWLNDQIIRNVDRR